MPTLLEQLDAGPSLSSAAVLRHVADLVAEYIARRVEGVPGLPGGVDPEFVCAPDGWPLRGICWSLGQAVAATEIWLILDGANLRGIADAGGEAARTRARLRQLRENAEPGDDEPTPPPTTPAAPIISADPQAGPGAEQ